ncbi:hypothetical protein P0D68_03630 [Paraburkholderia sp. RL17-380-BIE-A]|uniref:hypothetical protein n=1 Tax=Paraburkholderia sp. RL17-380-BIE-A TaxID=3031630 RepID=UPI0038BC2445
MSNPLNLDLQARAELMTYLVASNLLALELTGEWLPTTNLVESTKLWMSSNAAGAHVLERVRLAGKAHRLAQDLVAQMGAMEAGHVTGMFCDNLRLDFRSALVRKTYQECLNSLAGERWR